MIFDQTTIRIDRAKMPSYAFSVVVSGKGFAVVFGQEMILIQSLQYSERIWIGGLQQRGSVRKAGIFWFPAMGIPPSFLEIWKKWEN